MRARDLLRFSTKALTERKLKAVLIVIGIMIGPATIVALVGATQGYSNAASGRFSSLGATTILVSPAGRGTTLTTDDVSTMQSLPGVFQALAYDSIGGQTTQGGETVGVTVIATDLTQLEKVLPTLTLASGSVPSPSNQVGAVIGNSVAYPDIQGANNVSVGQVITLTNVGRSTFTFGGGGVAFSQSSFSPSASSTTTQRSFVVDGIYSSFGQGFGIDPDTSVFVPLSTGQLILHSASYSGIMVVASSASDVNNVITEIDNIYGDTVRATSVSSLTSAIQSVTAGTTTLLEAVAATSVLVAFIGIMTTMLTSVVERTKEIGIMKALGTSSKGIMLTFIAEALVVGLAGGALGAVTGVGLSYLIINLLSRSALGLGTGGGGAFVSSFTGRGAASGATSAAASTTLSITPAITPEIIGLAVVLAIAVGVVGGLLPAWRASRMNPVEALRRS
ncbi:MAG TPA: ABC transporter permease [Nitrososphaerales archaeon]|nr:ABC transporter permease [Nitrososphaerales archaeon]